MSEIKLRIPMYCSVCAKAHDKAFAMWHGRICSRRCARELEWRRAGYITKTPYRPDPDGIEGSWCRVRWAGDFAQGCIVERGSLADLRKAWIPQYEGHYTLQPDPWAEQPPEE